ncbi:WD_REPEATS_REGION domain-containing protein [Caerostris darwini]|uniref:WD_REPEATS_REGION domain-containing protein n=1 Tax=Caerostris darwini TaxID=1538125 RepID=A0AAV4QM58_9ARAC|nr:WD_REPEATS_REGION domain-containing protein [Caerostris darwini]
MASSESQETTEKHHVTSSTAVSDWANAVIYGNIKIIAKYEGENPPLCCVVLPNSKEFAVGWSDGIIEVRDTTSFGVKRSFEGPENLPVTCVSASELDPAKPLLLASYASGHTILWDMKEGQKLSTIHNDRQTLVNTFNIDCAAYAVSGSDAKIQIYDTETGTEQQILQGTLDPETMDSHTDRVFSLYFHPTKYNELLSGGWDDTVQFWDIRDSYSKRKIHGPHICGPNGIEFWGEEKFITASWRKRKPLQVWEYDSGKLLDTITPDDEKCFLYCCRYSKDEETLLLGGSHKNMMRIIDINAKMTIASIKGLKGAVYFVKELPKTDHTTFTQNLCFCSENSIYIAQTES